MVQDQLRPVEDETGEIGGGTYDLVQDQLRPVEGETGEIAGGTYDLVSPVVRGSLLLSGWFAAAKRSKHVYLRYATV